MTISGLASQLDLAPFTATFTFSEAVSGFGNEGDMMVSDNAGLTNFIASDFDTVYTVDVTQQPLTH